MFEKRWHCEKELEDLLAMPARRIGLSRYSLTGVHYSIKTGRYIEAESALEQDFLTLLEFDLHVRKFGSQPITLRWQRPDGTEGRYTPDVLVVYNTDPTRWPVKLRPTLFEVKPHDVLTREWPALRVKYRQIMGVAKAHGFRFKLITDRQIRTPRLQNARFLLQYRRRHMVDNETLDWARQTLLRQKLLELQSSTPAELLETISPRKSYQAELIPWLWNLMTEGLIGADLDRPLTMASPIWTLETKWTRMQLCDQ